MASSVQYLHPGITAFKNERGITVLQLHYDADPLKAGVLEDERIYAALREKGKAISGNVRTLVEDIKQQKPNGLSPWAYLQYLTSPSPTMYLQENEIVFDATLGEKLYFLHPEATLEQSRPIPEDWTRYMLLDPHPGVPHAAIWVAVDPWGDAWQYRELWPSKIYGKKGNIPEDDNRVTPREFIEVAKYLESAENPQNAIKGKAFDERIYVRIIDYAARSFGHTANDPERDNKSNFQVFFEQALEEFDCYPTTFEDCVKQGEAGADAVNEWLKPRQISDGGNGWTEKSRYHIFSDRCPETILQLNSNRKQKLTPTQAETQDPTGKAIKKRNHATDLIKYFCAANPQYVPLEQPKSSWRPVHDGIAY